MCFWGGYIEEVRGDQSGLRQGDRRRPRAQPSVDGRPGPGCPTRIQTRYSGYDVRGGRQLVDGGIYTSETRAHLFVTRELVHRQHPHPPLSAHVDVLVSMVAGGCVKVSLPALL